MPMPSRALPFIEQGLTPIPFILLLKKVKKSPDSSHLPLSTDKLRD